jgi:alkylated DNA repair dioxygenase AlkB
MQLDFFGNHSRVLTDDDTGTIVYHPNAIDAANARLLFDELKDDVAWRQERRPMYDRDVDVPRLVASIPPADAGALLRDALASAEKLSAARFNSIGLNFYRDGRDSVAPHNDHLNELTAGAPITILSLGAVRRMTIRSKSRSARVLDLDLEPGSLIVMSYETQRHYDHGIPKTKAAVGPRISVAFRVRASKGGAVRAANCESGGTHTE